MRLNPVQVGVLRELYVQNDYPSDRLARDRRALAAFARELCGRLGVRLSPEEVADELLRVRKDKKGTGGLPNLGRDTSGPNLN